MFLDECLALETSKEPAYHPHRTTFERIAFGDLGSLGSSEVISPEGMTADMFSPPIHCHIGPYLYFSGLACLVHPAMSKTLSDILGLLETGLLASWRVYPNFDHYGIAEP